MNYRKKPFYKAATAALIAAAALGTSGCQTTAQSSDVIKVQNVDNANNLITVTGREEVKIAPDMAQIDYSVYTQAATADECQTLNSENLSQAIETLKNLGVEESSIQTSSYGLNPIYDWNSGREITGYEMTTNITVTDIAIENAGTLISQSVASGVNQINSVSYFASNYDASYQEALKGAMAVASAKAQALAEASSKTVKGISHVEEQGYNPYVRYSPYNSGAGAKEVMETSAADQMAVMPGEVSIEAEVIVTFELQ